MGAGPFEPNWDSLKAYTVPDWFMDDKFGIFIHWGVYAVPAFGSEWYPRHMYIKDSREFAHHQETWGHQSEFGYKDFIPMFKAENWDPAAWVDLFARAGAKYVVPVAEHHDGFPMYATPYTKWNAAEMGPCRDVVAELAEATRAAGLHFGVSSHRAFNWRYYTHAENFDTNDPQFAGIYSAPHEQDVPAPAEWLEDWFLRTKELVDRFDPEVLWFDFGWHEEEFAPYWPQVAAYYYNHAAANGYDPVLQFKDKFPPETAVFDVERGKLPGIREHYWQTDTSVSFRSWCYIDDDQFMTVTRVVHDLVDIISKNGNLLLNVGPRPDGTIPDEAAAVLLGVGEWMRVNGEAVYGTRCWHTYGEGPTEVNTAQFKESEDKPFTAADIRFTTKGDALYAICMGTPQGQVTVKTLASEPVESVTMLGVDGALEWSRDEAGLTVKIPAALPCEHAVTLKIARRTPG